jgi:putative DNA primase/helicase
MNDTKERSINRWRSILGNFMPDELLSGKHGACPICGGVDRFRFDDMDGTGTFFCSKCGAGSGIHLLSLVLGCDHKEAWKKVEDVIGSSVLNKPAATVDREKIIKNILSECKQIMEGGEVWKYLESRNVLGYSSLLREVKSKNGYSMMVGRFAAGNKMTGLHVTFIKDGQKHYVVNRHNGATACRKMYGLKKGALDGSAIRLAPLGSSTTLIVAEGIETAISAAKRFGGHPVWATGSAGLLTTVQIPEQVTEIIIAGDCDESFTGQAAAYNLAFRLHAKKKRVTIHIPTEFGDWNDVKEI